MRGYNDFQRDGKYLYAKVRVEDQKPTDGYRVGDIRVHFTYVQNTYVSILAEQYFDGNNYTFKPWKP